MEIRRRGDLIRDVLATIKEYALLNPEQVNPFIFVGRVAVYIGLLVWGAKFIGSPLETNYVGESFLHNINLPFHEAGHLLFMPFGRFMSVLGGSLGQLLMPLACLVAFLFYNANPFAASVALWWFAESLMDLAPYINDARSLTLPLLGGVTGQDVENYHDWQYILRTLGWLEHDHTLAHAAYNVGILIMILTFVWGAYLLYRQYQNLART
jgi:hypothetical protein